MLREANLLKAYDVLELFTEMLAVRVQMIEKSKDTPPDMLEALSSIVYASQRVQVQLLSFLTSNALWCCARSKATHQAQRRNALQLLASCCVHRVCQSMSMVSCPSWSYRPAQLDSAWEAGAGFS